MSVVELDELEPSLDGEVPVYRHLGVLYDGEVRETHNGKLASTFTVVNGCKHGEELIYGERGELTGRLHWSGGLVHGRVEYFRPGGALEEASDFELGICIAATTFGPDGEVTRRYELSRDSFEYGQLERFRQQSVTDRC